MGRAGSQQLRVGQSLASARRFEVVPPSTCPYRSLVFVARWDLDKTYLRTDFDTVRDLLRTPL